MGKKRLNIFSIDALVYLLLLLLILSQIEILIIPVRGLRVIIAGVFILSCVLPFRLGVVSRQYKEATLLIVVLFYIMWLNLLGHGAPKDLIDLFIVYLLCWALYVLGIYLTVTDKLHVIRKLMFALFGITIISLLPYLFWILYGGQVDKRSLAKFYDLGNDNPLIMFWPLLFVICTISFYLEYGRKNISRNRQVALVAFYVIFLGLIIFSSYAAMTLLFLLSIFASYILRSGLKIKKLVLYSFAFAPLIYLVLFTVASGVFGELGGTLPKIQAILAFTNANSLNEFELLLDTASATRYSLLDISFREFWNSPFFGAGYYFSIVGEDSTVQVASGHSSIFDFFAYFGLFSFLFFMPFVKIIRDGYILYNSELYDFQHYGRATFVGAFPLLVLSIANPYLQFNVVWLLFLFGGICSGILKTYRL